VCEEEEEDWLVSCRGGLRLIEMPLPLREREEGVIQLAGREEKSHDFIASIRFGSYCSLGKAIPDHTLQ
jgi:hypothetical protein